MRVLIFSYFLFSISFAFAQSEVSDTVSYSYNGRNYKIRSFINNFKEELEVIKIKDGDSIADIGAGECFLEGFLFLQYNNLNVVANDIESYKLENLFPLIEFLKIYKNNVNTFHEVLGSDTSTNIKGMTFDKVIIRDALHHFKYPDKILAEVKELLKKEGQFFVIEMLVGETKTPPVCDKIFHREELFRIMTGNGFRLVKENKLATKNLIVFEFEVEQ